MASPSIGAWIVLSWVLCGYGPAVHAASFEDLVRKVDELEKRLDGNPSAGTAGHAEMLRELRETVQKLAAQQAEERAALDRALGALSQRLEALEKTEKRSAAPTPPQTPPGKEAVPEPEGVPRCGVAPGKWIPLKVGYQEGIRFQTEDKDFDLAIGGHIIENRRIFMRPSPTPGTFYNMDTQIELHGRAFRNYAYEFEGNFTGAAATLNNSYLEYQGSDAFQLRLGHFAEPFLYDETRNILWRDLPERPLIARLAPSYDTGWKISGKILESRLGYEVGYFNGTGRNLNDTNDDKDWAGRLTLAPFADRGTHVLKNLLFLAQGTTGQNQSSAIPDFTVPDSSTTFLAFDPATRRTDRRTRRGAGLLWARGPCSFKGEYATMNTDLEKGTLQAKGVRFDSWYATVGYVLTGEEAQIDGRIFPACAYPKGKGAWEAVGRVQGFQAEREPFFNPDLQFASSPQPTDSGTGSTTKVFNWTVGLNWTPVSFGRVMASYGHTHFGGDSIGAPGADTRGTEKVFLLSTQADF